MRVSLPVLAVLIVGCGGRDTGSGSDEIVIDSANARLSGLETTRSLAELPDGRVAIAQPTVPAVLVTDLVSGESDTIGKAGEGPGEYRSPGVVSVRHGNVELFDALQRRLTTWTPSGELVGSSTIATLPGFTVAFDTLGHLFAEQPSSAGFIVIGQEVDSLGPKDSTWIYRLNPGETVRDTVGRLYEIGWEIIRLGRSGIARLRRLYQSPDVWGALPDGSLWIARGRENRVDRRSPDGRWTIGAPRPFTPTPTTDADRQKLPVFPGAPAPSDTAYREMPKEKGPFSEAVAAPDGEVWTHLQQAAGATREAYAVFPVAGPSTRTVLLPKGRTLLALSERYLYTLHEDADGFRVLERYDRPRETR